MGDHDPYAEHFDAGHSGKDHTVHQRLRANSSIMELVSSLSLSRYLSIRCPAVDCDRISFGTRHVFLSCAKLRWASDTSIGMSRRCNDWAGHADSELHGRKKS